MSIIVNDMVIEDNLIDIKYMIVETGCEYEYKIEMSECL